MRSGFPTRFLLRGLPIAGGIVLVLILVATCRQDIVVRPLVDIEVEPAAAEAFQEALAKRGLPSTIGAAPVVYRRSDPLAGRGIDVEHVDRVEVGGFDVVVRDWTSTEPRGIVIAAQTYAPVTDFLDPRISVSLEDVVARDVAAMPLEEIRLPQKALAVDGLYPDDPGYPLRRRVEIVTRGAIEEIEEWARLVAFDTVEEVGFVAAVGDLMVSRGVDDILVLRENGIADIFGDTAPILQNADLTLGNLEGAVTWRTTEWPKAFNFRFRPDVLEPLKEAGFDYFSLANNHAWDYGEIGLIETLDYLEDAGIATSGTGRNAQEAAEPWVTDLYGSEVRILGIGAFPAESTYSGAYHSLPTADRAGMLFVGDQGYAALEEAFGDDSFDIVLVHGGHEYVLRPNQWQMRVYRTLVDLGADLVIGAHPHVLQGMEHYGDGLILYSLGNFVFPGMFVKEYAEDSAIARFGIYGGEIRYLEFVPARLTNAIVRVSEDPVILDRFYDLSRELR